MFTRQQEDDLACALALRRSPRPRASPAPSASLCGHPDCSVRRRKRRPEKGRHKLFFCLARRCSSSSTFRCSSPLNFSASCARTPSHTQRKRKRGRRDAQTANFSAVLRSVCSAAVSGRRAGHTSSAHTAVPSAASRMSPAASSTAPSVPTAASQTPPVAVRRRTMSGPARSCGVRCLRNVVWPKGVCVMWTNAGLADSEPVVGCSDTGDSSNGETEEGAADKDGAVWGDRKQCGGERGTAVLDCTHEVRERGCVGCHRNKRERSNHSHTNTKEKVVVSPIAFHITIIITSLEPAAAAARCRQHSFPLRSALRQHTKTT